MESFFSLLQKNVLNRRRWQTRQQLRLAIITWIESTCHRRRRQDALGQLTPSSSRYFDKPLPRPDRPPTESTRVEADPPVSRMKWMAQETAGASQVGGWRAVLELPPTTSTPATLQWVARSRSGEEVSAELKAAFARASDSVGALFEALAELPLAQPPADLDWHW
jgi:hypothetical protein